jgi:hypothetical protein
MDFEKVNLNFLIKKNLFFNLILIILSVTDDG